MIGKCAGIFRVPVGFEFSCVRMEAVHREKERQRVCVCIYILSIYIETCGWAYKYHHLGWLYLIQFYFSIYLPIYLVNVCVYLRGFSSFFFFFVFDSLILILIYVFKWRFSSCIIYILSALPIHSMYRCIANIYDLMMNYKYTFDYILGKYLWGYLYDFFLSKWIEIHTYFVEREGMGVRGWRSGNLINAPALCLIDHKNICKCLCVSRVFIYLFRSQVCATQGHGICC